MVESNARWCLFCDLEVHPSHPAGPQPVLNDYADALIDRSQAGAAFRVFENENRVTRIADAERIALADGSPGLAFVVTLGTRRGADPAFIHFENGVSRDAEKQDGEVKGVSAHCVLRLAADADNPSRHRMLLEEVQGIGRTPVTRLIASELKQIAEDRGERFKNPATNRMVGYRPIVEVHPRRSKEMADALDEGSFLPVELFDLSAPPAFDEHPEFQTRRLQLTVKVVPTPGRTMKQALHDLAQLASGQGYSRMRVSWREPGVKKGGSSEMSTDLADIGTALFAHRELVTFEPGFSECRHQLHDGFVEAMIAEFG